MKHFVMTPAGMGAVRFHISPVNQVAGLLRLAASGAWHPQHSRLARDVATLLRRPAYGILAELTPPGGIGNMPFVHLRPEHGAHTWEEELAVIEALGPDYVDDALSVVPNFGPRLASSREAGTVTRDVVEALRLFWNEVMADEWPRVERGLRAEVARCADILATQGVGSTLASLHSRVQWVCGPDGASLLIDKPIVAEREVGAEGIIFLPNAFLWDEPMIMVNATPEGVLYPARLPESRDEDGAHPMGRLIGATRSRVLDALASPVTTTALSAQLELAPSTISNHLKVLHAAGLVVRRREGQRVLYARTAS